MSAVAPFPLSPVRRAWVVRRAAGDPTLFYGHRRSAEDGEVRTEVGSLFLVMDKLTEPEVRCGLPIVLDIGPAQPPNLGRWFADPFSGGRAA